MKFLLLILIVTANAAIKCPEKVTSPLCGTDGKIHANACQLEQSASGKFEAWDKCVCSKPFDGHECTDKEDSVCGSDGKKYKNRCHLLTASCLKNGTVFETDDPPTTCKVHDCPITALQPMCAFQCTGTKDCLLSGTSKSNRLSFFANPCQIAKNLNLRIRPDNFCDCDVRGPCRPTKIEVCGNDKKMYKNRCELIHSRCKNPEGKLREVPTECCKTHDKTPSVDCL